jgi:hypothetical protein
MAKDDPDEKAVARQRDEVIKRMIATPPKTHKQEPKRRPTPSPDVRQLPKHRTNKKRDKA